MAPARILVVDDDELILTSLSELLKLEGYEVEAAGSFAEASAHLAAAEFDVVISDVAMPDVSGFELLKLVRNRYPDTAVVMATAYGSIENAVEAMPDGGEVRVGASVRDERLVIEVADTGPGIPEENLPRLFEPFFTRKQGGQGTGLGLVISKDLVEKQGGSLTAANRPEGGARFTISIPLAPGASGRLRP